MKEKLPLCKYCKDCSTGIRVIVKCTLTNDLCPMIRWCPVHNCPKMNETFKMGGCKIGMKEDFKRKEGGS